MSTATLPDAIPATAAAATPPAPERGAHGRFAKGNRGGLGNPFARQVAALRTALLRRLSTERLEKIVDALLVRAEEGNIGAAKLVLSYTLGKPTSPPGPDKLDQHEWDVFAAEALRYRELNDMPEGLGPEPVTDYVREYAQEQREEFAKARAEDDAWCAEQQAEEARKEAAEKAATSSYGENRVVEAAPAHGQPSANREIGVAVRHAMMLPDKTQYRSVFHNH